VSVLEIATPHGPAKVYLHPASTPVGALLLGHGAGGGVGARDLVRAATVAQSLSLTTALVEQPYRVAGRRSPAPAGRLDTAWTAVVAELRERELIGGAVIAGGRSSGARVACRTAADTGVAGVLCLAFPLHPPGRPDKSRQSELDAVRVPALVVQGESDPFGLPASGRGRRVVTIKGTHSLTSDLDALAAAVRSWLARVLTRAGGAPTRTAAPRAR
jgi:predicted alpha/beta-hydrolase family hydrolase